MASVLRACISAQFLAVRSVAHNTHRIARAAARTPSHVAKTQWITAFGIRYVSSGSSPHAGTEAVRFTVFKDDAKRIFAEWCANNTPFTKVPQIESIRTMYLPFWCFVADVYRSGRKRRGVSGPTLQVYSGHAFPRKMCEVLKNDISYARPFSPDMLLVGTNTDVEIEPFATFDSTAWQVARKAHIAHELTLHEDVRESDIKFDNVESHRVLMPAHIIEYVYLTERFRVFINGASGQVYGIQQQSVFGAVSKVFQRVENLQTVVDFLSRLNLSQPAQIAIVNALTFALRPLMKLLLWPPFAVGALLTIGGYAVARSTASIREQRQTFAEWQETRKLEQQQQQAEFTDDWKFRPAGRTERDRATERRQEEHQESARPAAAAGGYSRATTSTYGAASRARTAEEKETRARTMVPPYVNPDDYYAVLGIKDLNLSASQQDIQTAFRRELMKYHPDHQQESNLRLDACGERTRLVIKAYGVLRDQTKRREYDAGYRRRF